MQAEQELTESQWTELLHDFANRDTFCRESLQVQDRIGSLVPMDPWPSQTKLNKKLRDIRRKRKPVRLVILKTRRSGFTMGVTADMFSEIAFLPGRKGLIIANNYEPAGDEAFGYLTGYHKGYTPFERHGQGIELPEASIKESSPKRIQWGGGSIDIDDDKVQFSRISVLSAEKGDVGRGGGRQYVLADEVAFWRDAETTLTAVLNMVPKLPETTVIIQSTANGMGGAFYELCQQAQDPNNDSGWEFLFFGWLENPLCVMEVEDAAAFARSLDKDEIHLHTREGATLQNLFWRRHTIANECRGSLDLFHQEYPTTPAEAFLASGRPALDQVGLSRMPVYDGTSGELEEIQEGPISRIIFKAGTHGALTIWEKPKRGRRYVCGGDPSKGKDVEEGKKAARGENPDYSVGFVADADTGEQVALLRGRIRPVPFAEYLCLVCKWYNFAYMVPEANDAGFIDAIMRCEYPLEMIYKRQRDPTDRRNTVIEEIGFETTSTSRDWIIGAADDAIRTMGITIHSAVVLSECRTFVIKPSTGKKEHMSGHHDDTVIAMGLTALGMRFIPKLHYRPDTEGSTSRKLNFYGKKRKREEDD